MLTKRTFMTTLAAAGGYGLLPGFAKAQAAYPARPINLIIPFAAGGIGDTIGRAVGEKVAASLGTQVIVENRTGAGGIIGSQHVASAEPDGYTILQVTGANLGAILLQPNVNFNFHEDFVPVIGIGSFPCLLCTPANSEITSFDQIGPVSETKGMVTYASGGIGSNGHLVVAALSKELGVNATHVPFKGNSEGIRALLGGEVDLGYLGTADALELVRTGQLRALTVAAPERLPELPDVPTMTELGHGEFAAPIWYGYLAPAGTPQEIVTILHDAVAAAIQDPMVTELFTRVSYQSEVTDGAAFGAFIEQQTEIWGKVIADNGITMG